jgi:hypothetical protein
MVATVAIIGLIWRRSVRRSIVATVADIGPDIGLLRRMRRSRRFGAGLVIVSR